MKVSELLKLARHKFSGELPKKTDGICSALNRTADSLMGNMEHDEIASCVAANSAQKPQSVVNNQAIETAHIASKEPT